jgi:hypothetical protein
MLPRARELVLVYGKLGLGLRPLLIPFDLPGPGLGFRTYGLGFDLPRSWVGLRA